MGSLKPHSNGSLHSNMVTGTLAVDWCSEEGPGQATALPSPLLAVPNVTTHPSLASVSTSYYCMWHWALDSKGLSNYVVNSKKQHNYLNCTLPLMTGKHWRPSYELQDGPKDKATVLHAHVFKTLQIILHEFCYIRISKTGIFVCLIIC